jgi:hypothetical protein
MSEANDPILDEGTGMEVHTPESPSQAAVTPDTEDEEKENEDNEEEDKNEELDEDQKQFLSRSVLPTRTVLALIQILLNIILYQLFFNWEFLLENNLKIKRLSVH